MSLNEKAEFEREREGMMESNKTEGAREKYAYLRLAHHTCGLWILRESDLYAVTSSQPGGLPFPVQRVLTSF